jgi:hypothetical protein
MILHDEYSVIYYPKGSRIRMRSRALATIERAENFAGPEQGDVVVRIEHRSVTTWEPIDE